MMVKFPDDKKEVAEGEKEEEKKEKVMIEQAESPMSMLLLMSTFSGGVYVLCSIMYALVLNCGEWRREWKRSPENRVDADERFAQHVAAEIQMHDTGFWPRPEDPNQKSVLEACVVVRLNLDKDRKLLDPDDQNKITEGSTCVICLAELVSLGEKTLAKLPNCGHIFHEGCLAKWKTHTCPICREPVSRKPEHQS